ncbi:MAG: hypothetical protein K0S71_847 [Clostridia bacterium]|jgi:hypothetical protein|nr:hypothetical protein [Clostridia bacterium]
MKMKLSKISFILLSALLLFGCSPQVSESPADPAQDNNAAGIILAGADQAKNISVENVESVQLFDLDGNSVEKEVDKETVVKAFNDSMIDDTSYIEMIAGYRMVITLKDASAITITSYGDETRVVASTKDTTYHLISPELAKILLTQ